MSEIGTFQTCQWALRMAAYPADRKWPNQGRNDAIDTKRTLRSDGSGENSWKWIDPHGKEFGIGRPYLDKDPPHVGPIDAKEYADKRGRPNAKLAELETERRHGSAV